MRNGLTLLIALITIGFCPKELKAEDFPPLFPFVISYDGPDNATSMAHLLDAPAGSHGYIRVENGRFVNDAGPVRLNATNITGPANFPSHQDADRVAARLARFGINCVRLHYMDTLYSTFMQTPLQGILTEEPATQRNFDPAQVDKLDYLILALKKRGIYVNINLHVGRQWDDRDSFPHKDRRPFADKGLDNFEPRMIELQKEYARKLLTHKNPYTGLAYTDDPCVAVVEINNENALFQFYRSGGVDNLPDPYAAEFRRQWNGWLRKKYGSTDKLRQAWRWAATPPAGERIPEGNFSQAFTIDGEKWRFDPGTAKGICEVRGGALEIAITRDGGDKNLPKLIRRISVEKGRPYTLSFKIRRTAGTGVTPISVAGPKDATAGRRLQLINSFQEITPGTQWRTFTYPFLAGEDAGNARIALTGFKRGTYEIDDFSIKNGARSPFDTIPRIEDGAVPALKVRDYAPPQVVRDFYQFLYGTEEHYWLGMYRYLKDELKVKALVSGTQIVNYSPAYIQAQLDYIDSHSYWCYPESDGRVNGPPVKMRNEPMVNSMECIREVGTNRVLGKPLTISECNYVYPSRYGAECQPLFHAYGRLQGWDGIFQYSYNHYPNNFVPDCNTRCCLDVIARTDVLAHLPACAAIYLRGDVSEAKHTIVGGRDLPAYFESLMAGGPVASSIESAGLDSRLPLLHKTAFDLTGRRGTDLATVKQIPRDQKVFVSDTGELTWNVERPGAGFWTVNTPNTKLFTGFPQDRTFKLGGVTLAIGKTRLDWATVSLVSRKASGFGERGKPANILLAATGLSENKGTVIERQANNTIVLRDWGTGPVLAEGIPATVTLPAAAARVKCFALDPGGKRKQSITVTGFDGGSKIVLKPEYQTVWYEIDVK